MRAALGTAGVSLAFASAVLGVFTLAVGLRRRDPRILVAGRRFVPLVLAGAVVATAAMEWALLSHDFSIRYVAENSSRATPTLYTITALWGALEGSIILWSLVLAGYLAVMARRFRRRAGDPLVAWATLTGLCVAAFFFGMMLFLHDVNPFKLVEGAVPADGRGPNPLLQNHPLMAVHPPMLYLGYVGFTVPFSFAIAALVTGRVGEGWLIETRRATLVAWGFLTVGIILGGWWSYEVLGWGGYWAWDPVENASLLPWLTATAFLHSVAVQERRGMLRIWNLSLIVATFSLTIFGTFLTRSAIIDSVHNFAESEIGHWLLGFLAVVTLTGLGLIAWRGDRLRAPGRIDSPASREGAFLANNLLFTGFAFVVLLGTVFPLLAEVFADRRLTVGEPYFDRMTTPIGLALLFFMAVAPALPWRAASSEVLRRRLLVPAWIGAGTMAAAAALGARGVAQLVAFGLGAFAIAGVARQYAVGVAASRRSLARARGGPVPSPARGWGRALAGTVAGNPRLYGGLVVHVGVVLVAMALAASASYSTKREFRLAENETVTMAGHRFTYLGTEQVDTARKRKFQARVLIERGGTRLGVYEPALSLFPNNPQAIGTPSVRANLLRDVYLTLVSSPNEEGRITLGVQINPLVVWLWIGGGVMAAGTVIAIWPRRGIRRRAMPAPGSAAPDEPPRPAPEPEAGEPEEVAAR